MSDYAAGPEGLQGGLQGWFGTVLVPGEIHPKYTRTRTLPTVVSPDDPRLADALGHLTSRLGESRVTAVSFGGCIDAIDTDRQGAMRRRAHAHTSAKAANRGAICFKSSKIERAVTASGGPTTLLAHEFAHIATWAGHTQRWAKVLTQLGFPAEAKRCTSPRWIRVSEVSYENLTEDQRRVLRHDMFVSAGGEKTFRYYRAAQ
jgi:hypothetical protein